MRILAVIVFLLLAVPGTALAAPPANDNRADAAAIPSFPASIAGTTAEATVERLDPQVSRCGRVEATTWYRVDIAPDGLIAITVKGAAGVAPVVRVYRRGASAIQEADCGSAGPGGSASASLEAVRGSNYLVLVGRRPGDAGRRLRTLRPALPAAGERQPRRRAAAEAAGDGARLDPGRHRRRGGPRLWDQRRHRLVPDDEPARGTCAAAALGAGRSRRGRRRARACPLAPARHRLRPDRPAGTRDGRLRRSPRRFVPDRRRARAERRPGNVPSRLAPLGGGREQVGRHPPGPRRRPFVCSRAHGRQRRVAGLDAPRSDVQDRLLLVPVRCGNAPVAAEPRP